ncbi:hypothetical protein Tdes44962_MAKER02557 [Teratosphaeria destructans]|uniref:Uncharacterized protein n=1 Tax=Teratosphaeria destructans TaxID=418781 RepID=A0A9W7STA2_9PEZI|nr:hypothetical protein Tdes44962_MAKER02557 [Teratosphaeria destructans]
MRLEEDIQVPTDVIHDVVEVLSFLPERGQHIPGPVINHLVCAETLAQRDVSRGASDRDLAAHDLRDLDPEDAGPAGAPEDQESGAGLDVRDDGLVGREARDADGGSVLQTHAVGEGDGAVVFRDGDFAECAAGEGARARGAEDSLAGFEWGACGRAEQDAAVVDAWGGGLGVRGEAAVEGHFGDFVVLGSLLGGCALGVFGGVGWMYDWVYCSVADLDEVLVRSWVWRGDGVEVEAMLERSGVGCVLPCLDGVWDGRVCHAGRWENLGR